MGSRRWAKFAKLLTLRGYTVHVICSRNPFPEISPWWDEIKDAPGIVRHELPPHFPEALTDRVVKSTWLKVRFHVTARIARIIARGNIYDRAVFWKSAVLREASEVIRKENIGVVVATGAPFRILYYATLLKKRHPYLRVLADFRDPWVDASFLLGYRYLSNRRKTFEQELEGSVVLHSDVVLGVADWLLNDLQMRHPGSSARYVVLPNGFDPTDIQSVRRTRKDDGKIRFILTGDLYAEADYVFYPFLQSLKELKQSHPALFDGLDIRFFGRHRDPCRRAVKDFGLESTIQFFPSCRTKDIFQELADADFGLLFQHYDFAFSTKCVEYISLRKPILLCARRSQVMDEIEQLGIGLGCEPHNMKSRLLDALEGFVKGRPLFNPSYDEKQFSLDRITDRLVEVLEANDGG